VIKVALTLPNLGPVDSSVIEAARSIERDPRFIVDWFPCDQFQAKPLEWNQLLIARTVLKGSYDYWLSIDDDNAPLSNPLDYVEGDFDVLGFPVPKLLADGERLYWWNVAAGKIGMPKQLRWPNKPVHSEEGLCVGGGCWLVARRVLARLTSSYVNPFARKQLEDGSFRGNDFSFCERAWESGFRVSVAWESPCENRYRAEALSVVKTVHHVSS